MPLLGVLGESAATSIILIFVYLVAIALTILNYVGHFRTREQVYGRSTCRLHLGFTIISVMAFTFASGPFLIYAARYAITFESRFSKMCYAICLMFLLHDLPFLAIEYHTILTHGWSTAMQGAIYIIRWVLFGFSFIFSWSYYAWRASGAMETLFGTGVMTSAVTAPQRLSPPNLPLPETHESSFMGRPLSHHSQGGMGSVPGLRTGSERLAILPDTSAYYSSRHIPPNPASFDDAIDDEDDDFFRFDSRDRLLSPQNLTEPFINRPPYNINNNNNNSNNNSNNNNNNMFQVNHSQRYAPQSDYSGQTRFHYR